LKQGLFRFLLKIKDGEEILKIMHSPLFKILIRQGDFSQNDINELTLDLDIKRINENT